MTKPKDWNMAERDQWEAAATETSFRVANLAASMGEGFMGSEDPNAIRVISRFMALMIKHLPVPIPCEHLVAVPLQPAYWYVGPMPNVLLCTQCFSVPIPDEVQLWIENDDKCELCGVATTGFHPNALTVPLPMEVIFGEATWSDITSPPTPTLVLVEMCDACHTEIFT